MFAESFLYALDLYILDSTKVNAPYDFLNGALKKQSIEMYPIHMESFYIQQVQAMDKLIPFYKYYFPFYKVNKKAIVLELMTQLGVYDKDLFNNLITTLNNFC